MKSSLTMVVLAMAMVGCGAEAIQQPASPEPGRLEGGASEASSEGSALIQKATRAIQAGDFAAAKGPLEEARSKAPQNSTAAYYLGVTLEQLGDVAGARENYEAAIALAPELIEASINLGALLIDAGEFEEAIRVTRAGLNARPDETALLINLAMALEGANDHAGALEAYAKAVARDEGNATLRWQYAALLLESGEKGRAADELRRALDGAGDDRALLASIGRSLGSAGAYADCAKAFDRAIAVQDASELRLGRGLCRHSLKDEAGALEDFEAAVNLSPTSAIAHYYRGQSLLTLGKRQEAIRSLEEAARLAEDAQLAKKARDAAAAARKKK